MRNLLLLLISIMLIGCASFKPIYKTGTSDNIEYVIDSISKSDSIDIPSIDKWIATDYITTENSIYNLRSFYKEVNKRIYIITVYKDSLYHWTYRIE